MRSGLLFFSILTLVFGAVRSSAQAQDNKIYLKNPSFEDVPRHSQTPKDWIDCGFELESEPDIQPNGEFGVTMPAQHGQTYLGLVVRDNETWERVSQKVSRPLEKGKCYEFSIHLARSPQYISQSRVKDTQANYITPAKLKIYGGFSPCDRQFLLAESNLIINYRWLEFNFKFEPIDNYTYITFEAFYKTPNLFPYNGNILLDNASALNPIPCKEQPEVVSTPTVKPSTQRIDTPKTNNGGKPTPGKTPPITNPPVVAENNTTTKNPEKKPETNTPPKSIDNPDFSTLKKSDLTMGQTLRIPSITFAVNDTILSRASYPNLDKLLSFMNTKPDIVLEVGGHTNGLCADDYCNRLSLRRARAVVDYLVKKGVKPERFQVKGYGKTQPVSTVKNDPKNQRVEIKILDL